MAGYGNNQTSTGTGNISRPLIPAPAPAPAPANTGYHNTTQGGGSFSGSTYSPPASGGSSGGSHAPAAPSGPPPALVHLLGVGTQQAAQLWGQAQTVVGMSQKWGVPVTNLFSQIDKPPAGLDKAVSFALSQGAHQVSADAKAAAQVGALSGAGAPPSPSSTKGAVVGASLPATPSVSAGMHPANVSGPIGAAGQGVPGAAIQAGSKLAQALVGGSPQQQGPKLPVGNPGQLWNLAQTGKIPSLSPTAPDNLAGATAAGPGGVSKIPSGQLDKLIGGLPATPAPGGKGLGVAPVNPGALQTNPFAGSMGTFGPPAPASAQAPASVPAATGTATPQDLAKNLGQIANALSVGTKPGMANDVAKAGLSTIQVAVPNGGKGVKWVTTGATIDPTGGQTGDSNLSFAELQQAGQNAGLGGDLTHMLGLQGGQYGMPMGSKIMVRDVPTPQNPNPKAYTIFKNDVGSGQAGDPHYTTDLHPGIAQALGVPGKGDIQVARPGAQANPTSAVDALNKAVGIKPPQPLAGYVNPLASVKGLQSNRVDMGVDYAGTGPVRAIGNAKVFAAASSGTGWPGGGFIGYTLTDGPFKGKSVYVAENATPTVKVGDTVKAGQPVAQMTGGIETGWASGVPDGALAAQLGQQSHSGDPGAVASASGANFNSLLTALGAPGGTPNGSPSGQMPAGWPSVKGVPVLPVGSSPGGNMPAGAAAASSGGGGGGGSTTSGGGAASSSGSAAPGATTAQDAVLQSILGGSSSGSTTNPWLQYFQQNTPSGLWDVGSGSAKTTDPFSISLAHASLQALAGTKLTTPKVK